MGCTAGVVDWTAGVVDWIVDVAALGTEVETAGAVEPLLSFRSEFSVATALVGASRRLASPSLAPAQTTAPAAISTIDAIADASGFRASLWEDFVTGIGAEGTQLSISTN